MKYTIWKGKKSNKLEKEKKEKYNLEEKNTKSNKLKLAERFIKQEKEWQLNISKNKKIGI